MPNVVISGRPQILPQHLMYRRMIAGVQRGPARMIDPGILAQARELSEKAFQPRTLDAAAAAALAQIKSLTETLNKRSERRYSLSIGEALLSPLPQEAADRIRCVLGTNYSNMVGQLDYDFAESRSLFIILPEPVTIKGSTVRWIKLKGVCFDEGSEMAPFKGLSPESPIFPLIITFGKNGQVVSQQVPDFKPTGAMELSLAMNEFQLLELAFNSTRRTVLPLGFGVFNDSFFKGQRLGFIMQGLDGTETDLRSYFADLLGGHECSPDAFIINANDNAIVQNRQKIEDLFLSIGKAYRLVQDLGIFGHISHPGNILIKQDGTVSLSDFEYSMMRRHLKKLQSIAYRINDFREFVFVFRAHLNDNILSMLEQKHGIFIADLFLNGYFYDHPRRTFAQTMLDGTASRKQQDIPHREGGTVSMSVPVIEGSRLDGLMTDIHIGKDVSGDPLVKAMAEVIK